jgi:hypothetical protein
MTHRTDRTITSIIGLAEGLTSKLPAARDILRQRINAIDGFPVGTDTPKITATAELTTVEQAANQRIWLETNLRSLTYELNAAALIIANLHRECDQILGHQPRPRCTGGQGRQGAIEWGQPDCWNIPTRAGTPAVLCDRCFQAERKWRSRNGLVARDVA